MEALNYTVGADTTKSGHLYEYKFDTSDAYTEKFYEDKAKYRSYLKNGGDTTESICRPNNIILFPGTYTSSEVTSTLQTRKSYNDNERNIDELKWELMGMKFKLNKCIPTHAILYMILTTALFACSCTLLAIKVVIGIQIIDTYFLYCGIIMSIGLFGTAFLSLRDWKEFLNNERE